MVEIDSECTMKTSKKFRGGGGGMPPDPRSFLIILCLCIYVIVIVPVHTSLSKLLYILFG